MKLRWCLLLFLVVLLTTSSLNKIEAQLNVEEQEIAERVQTPLKRGDVNLDGNRDISDVVFILNYLFQGGQPSSCSRTGDVNMDKNIDITDAISLLRFIFQGGESPSEESINPADCAIHPNEDHMDVVLDNPMVPYFKTNPAFDPIIEAAAILAAQDAIEAENLLKIMFREEHIVSPPGRGRLRTEDCPGPGACPWLRPDGSPARDGDIYRPVRIGDREVLIFEGNVHDDGYGSPDYRPRDFGIPNPHLSPWNGYVDEEGEEGNLGTVISPDGQLPAPETYLSAVGVLPIAAASGSFISGTALTEAVVALGATLTSPPVCAVASVAGLAFIGYGLYGYLSDVYTEHCLHSVATATATIPLLIMAAGRNPADNVPRIDIDRLFQRLRDLVARNRNPNPRIPPELADKLKKIITIGSASYQAGAHIEDVVEVLSEVEGFFEEITGLLEQPDWVVDVPEIQEKLEDAIPEINKAINRLTNEDFRDILTFNRANSGNFERIAENLRDLKNEISQVIDAANIEGINPIREFFDPDLGGGIDRTTILPTAQMELTEIVQRNFEITDNLVDAGEHLEGTLFPKKFLEYLQSQGRDPALMAPEQIENLLFNARRAVIRTLANNPNFNIPQSLLQQIIEAQERSARGNAALDNLLNSQGFREVLEENREVIRDNPEIIKEIFEELREEVERGEITPPPFPNIENPPGNYIIPPPNILARPHGPEADDDNGGLPLPGGNPPIVNSEQCGNGEVSDQHTATEDFPFGNPALGFPATEEQCYEYAKLELNNLMNEVCIFQEGKEFSQCVGSCPSCGQKQCQEGQPFCGPAIINLAYTELPSNWQVWEQTYTVEPANVQEQEVTASYMLVLKHCRISATFNCKCDCIYPTSQNFVG